MAKVLNQERFLPPRLPGLSLWLDAQATTTISSTAAGVTSWADRSGMENTMNATTFYVPGCVLWLDASDPNATGVPATNGASITTWKDKSGLGCNATATGTPTIISTGLNGRPTMNFNGTSWFTGSTANTGTTLTCFAVAATTASLPRSGLGQRLVSFAAAGQPDWNNLSGAIGLFNQAGTSSIRTYRNVTIISSSPITQNTPFVAVSAYDGTSGSIWKNGEEGSPASTTSTGTFAISIYGIGEQAVIRDNETWNGYIGEVIVFNTALTTSQRRQVETYLSKKWGIPLSYSVPTTPLFFSPTPSPVPIISQTLTNQPSIFFPPGGQMGSILNSGLGAPTIPGCILWLDAADPTSYTYQSGSTTNIGSWRDKSSNGYVFTQAPVTTGAITTSIQNGKTALNFGYNVMTIPNFTWYTQFTTLFVLKSDNWFYNGGGVTPPNTNFYRGYVLSGNWNLIFTPGAGATYDPSYGTPGVTPVSSVIPNEWCIFSIGYGGGTQAANYAVNGTSRSTYAGFTPAGQAETPTPLYLNGRWDSAFGNTQVGEIIHFNRSITSQERQTVEGYLATKWGLRADLPPSHPYYSVPYTASSPVDPSGPVSKSLFMAYQCPQTSSRMRFAVGRDVSGQAFGLAQSNGVVYSPYQYGYGDTKWSVTANTYIVPTLASAVFDAGATMIRGDHAFNSFLDVRETALLNIIPNTPYVLGTSLSASSVFVSASFHVCEIIAYNRALATTDRQMIEGYLAWKWGMTTQLPNGHPYQKFPPTGEQVIVASTPSNLYSGLVSWLDMADSTTYTLSGNTTILKTLTDKAGGGGFTISGNVSISTLGSLPSLSFTGNNSAILQLGGFLSKTLTVPPRGCAFAVFTPASEQLGAEKLGLLGWGSPGNNSNNPALGYTSQSSTTLRSYNPIAPNPPFYGPSISLTVSKPAILFWAWYNGNMVYLASNGNAVLSSPQTTGLFNPVSTNNIFYIGNDGGFGAKFNLGELCVYNDYLETPFRNILEGYLAWKWGVQSNLPAVHPYALSAPTLQSLTEVNALSQPTDISGLTMWLDAGDTATLTGNLWLDKSAISNNLSGIITPSNFGPPARPSIYFGPGTSATSLYNSGADSKQFSAFLVASIPTLSYLLISTGQLTTGTTGVAGQTFAFYANKAVSSVFSPYVVQGTGATNNAVGNYSAISGKTFELFASICGTAVSGNMNFATPPPSRTNTANNITATPWVFGNCTGDTLAKSFHVHEFITYSRPVTTIERQIIEGYLYWKWMV